MALSESNHFCAQRSGPAAYWPRHHAGHLRQPELQRLDYPHLRYRHPLVVGTAKSGPPSGLLTGAALSSLAVQQLIENIKTVLLADQVKKFEAQAFNPPWSSTVVFAFLVDPTAQNKSISFHVR